MISLGLNLLEFKRHLQIWLLLPNEKGAKASDFDFSGRNLKISGFLTDLLKISDSFLDLELNMLSLDRFIKGIWQKENLKNLISA